jgi:hypothetical protein
VDLINTPWSIKINVEWRSGLLVLFFTLMTFQQINKNQIKNEFSRTKHTFYQSYIKQSLAFYYNSFVSILLKERST